MLVLYFPYFQLLLATFVYGIDSRYRHTFFEIQHPSKQKSDEFNAIDDLRPLLQKEVGFNDLSIYDSDYEFQNQNKKSDYKPKYDPGWKFIGLGKRPLHKDYLSSEGFEPLPGKVNPLWGISTLINFEFFNALKDNLENTDKEPVKKGEGIIGSSGISSVDSGSQRYNNKMGWYGGGRQKTMYDPGWMLTGLGK